MQLLTGPTSPYCRKVDVLLRESGLRDHVTDVMGSGTPIEPNPTTIASNPLGKIPALVLDDGTTLFDSRVICEYLDSLHQGRKCFPQESKTRWVALRRQALADGILDAAVGTRYETALRPEHLRWIAPRIRFETRLIVR